jgi:hypothetical protein
VRSGVRLLHSVEYFAVYFLGRGSSLSGHYAMGPPWQVSGARMSGHCALGNKSVGLKKEADRWGLYDLSLCAGLHFWTVGPGWQVAVGLGWQVMGPICQDKVDYMTHRQS